MPGTPSFKSARMIMAATVTLAGALFATWLAWPVPSEAETIACFSQETGDWVNPHAESRDVSRVEIESECKGSRLVHRVRVFTSCAPRDCTWGWTRGEERGPNHFVATFSTFSAYRYIDMSVDGDRARITVTYDYHDDRKPKTVSTYSLRRED